MKSRPSQAAFHVYRVLSVGTGELVLMPVALLSSASLALSAPVSLPVVSLFMLKSGIGDTLSSGVGVGMGGTVRSGQGEAVTFPRPAVSPQAHRSRLSSKASIRYAKDLFISFLLSVFAQLLSP